MAGLIPRHMRQSEVAPRVMLTPMIDIFTILLLFLLKSYTAADIAPAAGMRLPLSTSLDEAEIALKITVTKEKILVDDVAIAPVQNGRVHRSLRRGLLIQPLFDALETHAERKKKLFEKYPEMAKTYKDKMLLLADESIPSSLIDQVLYTAARRNFAQFDLLVLKKASPTKAS